MLGAKVLIIDDEPAIQNTLSILLEEKGFRVYKAPNGYEGLKLFKYHRPEIILLDLGLPDLNGIEVLHQIRIDSQVPVIVLTVESETDKIVKLLEIGGDDYMTKPFEFEELLARIRVALKHSLHLKTTPFYKNGPLKINLESREVLFNENSVKLTATEYDVLKLLAKNQGKIVTQRQMLSTIWGKYADEYTHYIRIYISQLRKKLNKDFIVTEQNLGYRLKVFV